MHIRAHVNKNKECRLLAHTCPVIVVLTSLDPGVLAPFVLSGRHDLLCAFVPLLCGSYRQCHLYASCGGLVMWSTVLMDMWKEASVPFLCPLLPLPSGLMPALWLALFLLRMLSIVMPLPIQGGDSFPTAPF